MECPGSILLLFFSPGGYGIRIRRGVRCDRDAARNTYPCEAVAFDL